MGGFIGVNYAASKLPWQSSASVSLTLALLAVGLWFLFDRTVHGFITSTVLSLIGTGAGMMLVMGKEYEFIKADFYGIRSWLPCVLYCGCICFGSIGRQLVK